MLTNAVSGIVWIDLDRGDFSVPDDLIDATYTECIEGIKLLLNEHLRRRSEVSLDDLPLITLADVSVLDLNFTSVLIVEIFLCHPLPFFYFQVCLNLTPRRR